MIAALPYAIIAILFILVVALLPRERRPSELSDAAAREYRLDRPGNGKFLKLSDRIFDSDDYRWLRDTVGRADLARALARSRKELAIRWLEGLRSSFNELVRTPETVQAQAHPTADSWGMLWMTLRFDLLMAYVLFVVRTFGPYPRLLPTLSWRRLLPGSTPSKSRFSTAD
jgi:hypothetical protein